MSEMRPRVSVVVRTRNAERFLPNLLASLRKQTFCDWEIVSVLHRSSDRSEEILRGAGATTINYPEDQPFNYSKALNIGAEAATGTYVLNLSSHVEIVRSDTLERMVALMEAEQLAAVTVMRRFPGERYGKKDCVAITTRENFQGNGGLANYCGMIPRRLWQEHPFPEVVPTVEDSAWAGYWLLRGAKTAWLNGHAALYRNPQYSVAKLFRDRSLIALVLSSLDPASMLRSLAKLTSKNAMRFLRSRRVGLLRCVLVEIITARKLDALARDPERQESIRTEFFEQNPGLQDYVADHLRPSCKVDRL